MTKQVISQDCIIEVGDILKGKEFNSEKVIKLKYFIDWLSRSATLS
jgi:hypothetical protein